MEEAKKDFEDWWGEIEETFAAPLFDNENPSKLNLPEPIIDWKAMARKAFSQPRLPKLDPLPSEVMIAMEYWPGFSHDYTSWNLTIDRDGTLRQHICIYTPKGKCSYDYQIEHIQIDSEDVIRISKLAADIGFASFRKVIDCITTDVESARISLRLNGEIVTHVRDGDGEMSEEQTRQFKLLLQQIRQHAPFPQRYICYLSQRPT